MHDRDSHVAIQRLLSLFYKRSSVGVGGLRLPGCLRPRECMSKRYTAVAMLDYLFEMSFCIADAVPQNEFLVVRCRTAVDGIPTDYTQAAVDMSQPYDTVTKQPCLAKCPVSWRLRWAESPVTSRQPRPPARTQVPWWMRRLGVHATGLAGSAIVHSWRALQRGAKVISIAHMGARRYKRFVFAAANPKSSDEP